jgi:hypothetical protein
MRCGPRPVCILNFTRDNCKALHLVAPAAPAALLPSAPDMGLLTPSLAHPSPSRGTAWLSMSNTGSSRGWQGPVMFWHKSLRARRRPVQAVMALWSVETTQLSLCTRLLTACSFLLINLTCLTLLQDVLCLLREGTQCPGHRCKFKLSLSLAKVKSPQSHQGQWRAQE